jgi:hypothetical protein
LYRSNSCSSWSFVVATVLSFMEFEFVHVSLLSPLNTIDLAQSVAWKR